MKTIYFIRHGESEGNRDGLICGTHDSKLTNKGREQANLLGKSLRNAGIGQIISSDLIRAKETAEIVTSHLYVNITFDKDLRERACGIFDGKPYLETKNHKEWKPFMTTHNHRVDGSESISDIYKRAGKFLEKLVTNTEHERILLSSHGGILWVLVPFVLGIPIENYRGIIGMDNCSLSIFSWENGFALERLNCVAHLGNLANDEASWRF